MKFQSYDIVFQEVPNEVSLAINISSCPNRCKGCHSPHLQQDEGEILDESTIENLINTYGGAITCICFMGGDAAPDELCKLAKVVKQYNKKTAWYSGRPNVYEEAINSFDYIKIGQYIDSLGGLTSSKTNQRFYKIENSNMIDITNSFHKK